MGSTGQSLLNTFPVSGCPVGASSSQAGPKDPATKVQGPLVSPAFALFFVIFRLKPFKRPWFICLFAQWELHLNDDLYQMYPVFHMV